MAFTSVAMNDLSMTNVTSKGFAIILWEKIGDA